MPNRSVGTDKKSCGLEYNLPKGRGTAVILYNGTGSAIAKGDVMEIDYNSSTEGQEVQAIACATSTSIFRRVVVALEVVANGSRGRFCKKGICDAYVYDASTLAAGRHLEVLNGNNEFKDAGGTSRVIESAAVLREAYTASDQGANALKSVYLIGEEQSIKAS